MNVEVSYHYEIKYAVQTYHEWSLRDLGCQENGEQVYGEC